MTDEAGEWGDAADQTDALEAALERHAAVAYLHPARRTALTFGGPA